MKLRKIAANACGGISPNASILVDFEGNGAHLAVAKADNAKNKTSLLRAAEVGVAALSADKDLINKLSNSLDIDVYFKGNDRIDYVARTTKSNFTLRYEGDKNDIPSPKETMRKVFGATGLSPMGIKSKSLDEIVKWLASYTNRGAEEFQAQIKKLKDEAKKWANVRADSNKSVKGINEFLGNEPLYTDYEKSQERYKTKIDLADLSKRLKLAGDKSDKYIQNETKVAAQKDRQKQLEEQIKKLQQELAEVNQNIEIGEQWLTKNAAAKTDYDAVKKEYDNAAQEAINYDKWQTILQKEQELYLFEDTAQKADAKEKELWGQLKEVRAEIIPDVKGIDLVLDDEMEDGKIVRKEGLYWNGKNVAQLSESELWALVIQIWRKNKVRFVVIDNFQDLGTMAVEHLQKLIKDGAYVLAAEMSRGKEELTIEYA